MAVSERSLAKFHDIYKREFGKDLARDELERKARTLLNLYLSVYRKTSRKRIKKLTT